jgi:hypothetical protein
MCLSKTMTKRVAIPGRPFSLWSGDAATQLGDVVDAQRRHRLPPALATDIRK